MIRPAWRNGCCLLLLALAAAGCGGDHRPGAVQPGIEPATDPEDDIMVMSGIDLYMHDMRPTAGLTKKPTFWVHADEFSIIDDNVWAFEDARAVIYGQNLEDGNIILEARRGHFEESRRAFLQDDVVAQVGAMTIHLSDIEWRNPGSDTDGIALSDNPVRISDPDLEIEASSLRLYPADKRFELTGVTGQVRFERSAT
jgi:hypothetical protein